MIASPAYDSTDPHPGDGVLLALHDGERDEERGAELDAGRAHVGRCDACRARLADLAAHSRHVRESVTSIAVPAVSEEAFRRRIAATIRRPVPVWRRPAWQAAAAAIILAGAAAASPVRTWIRRRLEQPRTEARATPAPSVSDSAQSANRAGATVSFAAAASEFTLRLDSVPQAGTLTAASTSSGNISARVASGAGTGGDDMVVLPGELRVRNSTSSRASYELSLPSVVTRFRLIVAGRTVFEGPPPIVLRLDRSRQP